MFKQVKLRILAAGMALVLPTAGWGEVNFAQKPLAAGGGVDPNLMFILDDSGSMRFGFMPEELESHFDDGDCGWQDRGNYAGMNLCYADIDSGNRFLASSHKNKIYYDPAIVYEPPLAADGSPMDSVSFNQAPVDGFASSSFTVDLGTEYRAIMDPYYYGDRDGWGFAVSEDGEAEPAFYYSFSGSSWCLSNPYNDGCYSKVVVSESERQNFANWFSYYRTREMAAKSGIGSVFANMDLADDFRLGWGRINKGYSTIDGADNIKAVISGVRPFEDSRSGFLAWLYGVNSSGSTPLRSALEGAGRYYENSIVPWLDDPASDENTDTNPARECRISATMLMTDGYYGSDTLFRAQNDDGTDGDLIDNQLGDQGQYIAEAPFSDQQTARLSDIATYYWKRDLRVDIDNYVPIVEEVKDTNNEGIRETVGNPAFWQHMMTYGIGFGVEGTVSRDDAVSAVINGTSVDWWDGSSQQDKINDLLHASMNGRGDFFSAGDPATFKSELEGLLDQFLGTAGSATGLDFNAASIDAVDAALSFSASYEPNGWSGELRALTLEEGEDGLPAQVDPDADGWRASEKLAGIDQDSRTVLTYNADEQKGVPFRWTTLSAAQKSDLEYSNAALGPLRVEYLRGKRKEIIESENDGMGQYFRDRSSLLGTIVNSTPRYVGKPDSEWPNDEKFGEGDDYSVFVNSNLDRTPVVYVGANDGMLHAFQAKENDEGGGQELMAYVPSFVSSAAENQGLHYLTQPGFEHRYYVDLNLEVVDVWMKGRSNTGNGIDNTEKWRTVLIGGARAGAKGIFALDITDPDSFSEGNAAKTVLWEFTHPKLGYLVEPPEIALMEWPSGEHRWTVFVPSGYNSGSTGFFMLDLEKGLDGEWSSGDYIYHEFDSSGSGLSPVTVVDAGTEGGQESGDFVVDRLYAGDLEGNLWVAVNTSEGMETAYSSGGVEVPYFKADQPITSAVGVAIDPDKAQGDPGIMVMFGTGKYLENGDVSDTSDQYFYAVFENYRATEPGPMPRTATNLEEMTISDQAGTINNSSREVRVISDNKVDYDNQFGWFAELPDSGERIVNYPVVYGESVLINTLVPGANPCLGGGDGWVMGFEIFRSDNDDQDDFEVFTDSTENAVGFRVGSTPSQLSIWGNLIAFGTGGGNAEFVELPEIVVGLGRKGWREMTE